MSVRTETAKEDPQRIAADPQLSAFVTANAGSGKTKTLIDRVARLLLTGAKPETLLCVTYTKAAASEMQRRLFKALGDWSILPDADLQAKLTELEGRPFSADRLSKARALFAQALETPGGLKIQTIHAFCEKLLRRFPLEAGVSPGFRVLDDTAAAAVAAAARAGVARYALRHDDHIGRAYSRMAVQLDFGAFETMFRTFENCRGALGDFFDRNGGLAGAESWVWRAVDILKGTTPEEADAQAMAEMDRELWRGCSEVLQLGSPTDKKYAAMMRTVADDPGSRLADALPVFFSKGSEKAGEGDPAKWMLRSKVVTTRPTVQNDLLCEQARLEAARDRVRGAAIALETTDVLVLAKAYLEAFRHEKATAGALDFTDLIDKTRRLLRDRPAAAWVLYKLDGGIDHILLDEAQDTAPDQWKIIDALTEEFWAGAGPGGLQRMRRMFVVGDEKQSIYSFQGAQPEQLLQKFEFHRDRATGAGLEFRRVDLVQSWRSAPQVLTFVDTVFAPAALAGAIQPGRTEAVRHTSGIEHPGCVDVWPLEVDPKSDVRNAWDAPLDIEPEESANRRLARRIAREIQALIARGDRVRDKAADGGFRAAHAGDVLILVRRRKALFQEILRALKHQGVPVAGADRLALSEHIVSDDLLALARFTLFPQDELTLAALLKSPFCGLEDEDLYDLAHGRDGDNLWARLQRRADERPLWREAVEVLRMAQTAARTRRPYEFYARVMAEIDADGRSMRQRLLTRLGAEAQDALDEFLGQVLAAEQRGVHDLERLAAELARMDITVGREIEPDRREVRVMTTHGAKGLEAPIVILPETTIKQGQRSTPLMPAGAPGDEGFLWCGSSGRDCTASAAAREARAQKEENETFRLLYVALTRARDRLILCGRLSATSNPDKVKGWWGAVRDALDHADLQGHVRDVDTPDGMIRRYGPDPQPAPASRTPPRGGSALPDWARVSAPAEAFARYASPSQLGEDAHAASASPLAVREGLGRFRRGDLIHRLLQLLPDLPPPERSAGAAALLAREPDLTDVQRAEMAQAALTVLEDPQFSDVFGPGSRAEVAIAGTAAALPAGLRISGRIDRLVVAADVVRVVDFKTNRPSPDRIEDADPAYLRQMALYAAVLGEVFPGRRIEAAIVWTDGPKLMAVPENLVLATLSDLRRDG